MGVDFTQIARSIRMSGTRDRVLRALTVRERSYLHHLADDTGLDCRRVRWALHGDRREPPRFAPERSLVALGLARRLRVGEDVVYEVTPLGRQVAAVAHTLRPRLRR